MRLTAYTNRPQHSIFIRAVNIDKIRKFDGYL